jgi:acetylornithine deacetylase
MIATPRVEAQLTIDLLRQLVQIDSVNPSLVPGGNGEEEIAAYVCEVLTEAGIEASLQPVQPGRPNVVARIPGAGRGSSLILNAHLDTVSAEGMEAPFSARVADGRLYGRGAWDTKSGLAAGLSALLALADSGISLSGDLVLVGAVDEEHASTGTQSLLEDLHADGCIILEPTNLDLWVAHGGFAWVEIETEGLAAHGSLPNVGVDAITKMGHVLSRADQLRERMRRAKNFHSPLGGQEMHPSLHASVIEGGREWSSYPDRCHLRLERRMIPSEKQEDVERELDDLISALASEDPQFKATWRLSMIRPPWQAQEGSLFTALENACRARLGHVPGRATGLMWTDAALMQQAGIPTVIIGPRGEGKHALVEYVELDSVVACAQILLDTALSFCGESL